MSSLGINELASYLSITIAGLFGTIVVYYLCAAIQRKLKQSLLNPMLVSICVLIPILLVFNIEYSSYMTGANWLNYLLEPAIVALGLPLYEQLNQIKSQWKVIAVITAAGAFFAVSISLILALVVGSSPELAATMALKSITTAIALELATQVNAISSLTALSIIFAGIFGAIWGIGWLKFLKVKSPVAQGLAMGSASHAFGTASISQVSFQHGAYSSLALILSAIFTALIAPVIIPLILNWYYLT